MPSAQQNDFFEVELTNRGGKPLPAIEYDGQRWFVGEPGQEFMVQVNYTLQSGSSYEAALKMDGQGPGYTKIICGHTKSNKTAFKGWLGDSGPGSRSYKLFKFGSCKPCQAAATVSNPDDIQAGKVEVTLTSVVDSGKRRQPASYIAPVAPTDAAASKKLPEGKKWFLAPGLKAEAGSAVAETGTWNTVVWQRGSSLPSLQVRYDSSEALYLRKALNPRFAPHRAILRQSANPAIASLGAEPAPKKAPGPAAAAAAGKLSHKLSKGGSKMKAGPAAAAGAGAESSHQQDAAARVKREAGVKRERGLDGEEEDYCPRSATAADRVDLTEEPVRPMAVHGRQLAPDELAVCDLCDSDEDEAAPRWQVKKQQQVEVEP